MSGVGVGHSRQSHFRECLWFGHSSGTRVGHSRSSTPGAQPQSLPQSHSRKNSGVGGWALLAHPWSAQPQNAGGPNSRVSLECPTLVSLECQPQSLPIPECAECPTPECPWSAQPQSIPGVPNAQSLPGVPNPRVSLPREGGDVRSKIVFGLVFLVSPLQESQVFVFLILWFCSPPSVWGS